MSGAAWIGTRLFLGRTIIGRVEQREGEGGGWLCFSYLPGAAILIARDQPGEARAKEMVMKSAQSRCKAMFGAGIDTTATAVSEGRALRVTARAIWRAGVWRCDRPVNAHAMFADLGAALGMPTEDAPRPSAAADHGSASTAEPMPEEFDPIESERMHA